MTDWMAESYQWFKALHIIAIIAWMAALLYLPRLFVYHADAAPGSDKSETFRTMERRLLRIIMNPAMIASWVFGLLMLAANPALLGTGWMHAKLTMVVILSGVHGYFAICYKKFSRGENRKSARHYRIWNEAPTLLMVVIVIMAVLKPF